MFSPQGLFPPHQLVGEGLRKSRNSCFEIPTILYLLLQLFDPLGIDLFRYSNHRSLFLIEGVWIMLDSSRFSPHENHVEAHRFSVILRMLL